MTQDAQSALRRTMEQYSRITRFCLVCNYVTRIIEPLASRCSKFRFKALDGASAGDRISEIAAAEGLTLDEGVVETLIRCSEGDLRRAITYLQSAARLVGATQPVKKDSQDDTEMTDADSAPALITVQTVEEIAGVVPETVLDKLSQAMQPKKIGSAYEAVAAVVSDIVADGWSATQVLTQVCFPLLSTIPHLLNISVISPHCLQRRYPRYPEEQDCHGIFRDGQEVTRWLG